MPPPEPGAAHPPDRPGDQRQSGRRHSGRRHSDGRGQTRAGRLDHDYLRHDGPIALAHRGGAAERPENSWAAFEHAVSIGYRWIETDVRATADGVVAMIHDPSLERVADRGGTVADLTWAEVAAARLAGTPAADPHAGAAADPHGGAAGGPDGAGSVPRLDEVLAAWPDLRWNIDAKDDRVVEPLIEVIRGAGALGRVCVTSFSDARTARARRLAGPGLCTATGPRSIAALRAASLLPARTPLGALGRAGAWGHAGATQVPLRHGRVPVLDRRYLDAAHRAGLAVHVWTVDDEATMRRLLDMGVDGIMTDRPSLLRSVLESRGEW